ncbi:hypothetical protein [Paraburkholderia graminis]|uniref:hypothetical protein n=1 Tax=Paraburkholderia graminis TaxID=60548 RepID=UPI0038BD3246
MSAVWGFSVAPATAYARRARLIVELIDPVTLGLVHEGLKVEVAGLQSKPAISSSGRFVWFHERDGNPTALRVEAGGLPYLLRGDVAVPPLPPPAPPARPVTHTFMRVELGPSTAYPFDAGITVLRGNLVRNAADEPPIAISDAAVRLRWIDDDAPGEQWMDAPTTSFASDKGDFAVMLRLAPGQIARADVQHLMRVRVAVTRAGSTRLSPEMQIPFHAITDVQASFAWDDLQP